MRVLITGGAGFLGSHLCDRFIAEGHTVIAMDNLSTGQLTNVRHLRKNRRFTFVNHNVTKFIRVDGPLGAVLHFASPASPIDYAKLPIPTLKVGALGTHNALGLAKDKKAVFMLASTSEVYGDPKVNPQGEEYWGNVNPIGPRGVYDEAKRFAEALTMAYHRFHGMPVRIVRMFNTFGPRMRLGDGRAVPNFMTQAIKGRPITVNGTGKQTRSLCYVSDLIDGIYRLLLADINEPINLGNPSEITVLDLAKTIKRVTCSRSRIVFKPLPVDDPHVRCPNISKAKRLLHWKPNVSLEEGLRRTLPYMKEELSRRSGSAR